MLEQPIPETPKNQLVMSPALIISGSIIIAVFLMAALITGLGFFLNTPAFTDERVFTVNEGESARTIAERLADEGIVRSEILLYVILALRHDPTTIKASTYVFDTPLSTTEIAERITLGDFDTDLLRLTLIEGERVDQIAARAAQVLTDFDSDSFTVAASAYEGVLFPDTYFIPATFTYTDLLTLLTRTFDEKINRLDENLDNHPLGRQGVVTLASIVEREANSQASMKMVAGILQNRLEIQMPLQADATIEYVVRAPLNTLRPGELAQLLESSDSPYNSYRYPGLPPTPIGNPGIDAIEAVLHPTPSSYYYYITGDDGEFYYAETYEQHLTNIERHLR